MFSRMTLKLPWRVALPLMVLVLAVLFTVFFDTAHSIVNIWNNYETFTHGYIIVPICLWLIWKQRGDLASITPQPSKLGILVFGAAVFAWLLGELSNTPVVMHYAFAVMVSASVLALLGWRVARSIRFPLVFLLLAVPFGDALIEPMMNLTADFTVAALQLTGIPLYREGNTITLPSGVWSVVEACSGVRYLIASITLGIIYAHMTYRSIWRQMLFVLASILVPVLANGMRAYMIVMIGHLSEMKYAVGVDHLIYGWVFFGLVMLILFWVGGFWREDDQPAKTPVMQDKPLSVPPVAAWKFFAVAVAMFAVAGAAPAYSSLVARFMAKQPPVMLQQPAIENWRPTDAFTNWHPEFKNPAAQQMRYFLHQEQAAGLYIGYYRNQSPNAGLIGYGNVLAMPGGDQWRRLSESSVTLAAANLRVRQNLLAHNNQRLLGWYWYWVGDRFTDNAYVAKAYLALNRLLMRRDDSAVIVVFAPYSERPDEAAATLRQLLQDALPVVRQQLEATKRQAL